MTIFCRVFRDVPSDITIEVNGGSFSLHKASIYIVNIEFMMILINDMEMT